MEPTISEAATKFDGHVQTTYPRKNWSSVMLFNNSRCTALTPAYVNRASGLELHRFYWLQDEEIGSLPREWNHLVGDYDPNRFDEQPIKDRLARIANRRRSSSAKRKQR